MRLTTLIVLDTNVLSETLRPQPNPAVMAWLNDQAAETLFITSVTVAELLFGAKAMPDGKRKARLNDAITGLLALFDGRVLPFDATAATVYADLAAAARAAGRGFPTPDAYIAAIACARGFVVATRDTGPFEAARLDVINPWR